MPNIAEKNTTINAFKITDELVITTAAEESASIDHRNYGFNSASMNAKSSQQTLTRRDDQRLMRKRS